jgi:hypothetical protein
MKFMSMPSKMRARLLPFEIPAPLDGGVLSLPVQGFPRTGDVRYFVSSVVEDRLRVRALDDEITLEKVHHTHHLLIPIRLLLYEDDVRGEDPRAFVQMFPQGDVQTVSVFRWDTANIPLFYPVIGRFVE